MSSNYGSFEDQIGTKVPNVLNSQRLPNRRTRCNIPKRIVFSLFCFTACCLAAYHNQDLSITIVSMLDPNYNENQTSTESLSPAWYAGIESDTKEESMQVQWSAKIVGIALGGVNYGHLLSFIPGGRLAELFGGKNVLICSLSIAALSSVLSPISALSSSYAFIAIRILAGIGTGPSGPIIYSMLTKWIPEQEINFFASCIFSGYCIGAFLTILSAGSLCSTNFMGGWPSVYYVGALLTIFWCILGYFFMSESPDSHPSITDEELQFIIQNRCAKREENISKIPWKDIALSIPFWALAIGFFGQFWLLGFFATVQPFYMATVLDIPVEKNGFMSCLPHLVRGLLAIFVSFPVDRILKRQLVSVGFVRKGATILNTVVPCCAFLGIVFVGRNVAATTALFILAGMLGEFISFGVFMACIDIAPNLSGTVSGIANTIGEVPFFLIPALVAWLTNYGDSFEEWTNVYYITIAIVVISTIIFTAFGDLKPQPWGVITDENQKENPAVSEKASLAKQNA